MITIIWEVRKLSTISLKIYDVLSVWKCILYVKDSLLELEITNVWSIFDAKSNVHLHYFSIWWDIAVGTCPLPHRVCNLLRGDFDCISKNRRYPCATTPLQYHYSLFAFPLGPLMQCNTLTLNYFTFTATETNSPTTMLFKGSSLTQITQRTAN